MEPATATALIAGGATLIGGFLGNQQSASNTAADELVFGYQERYAEYRYKPSEILGTFSSSAPGTLFRCTIKRFFLFYFSINFFFVFYS